MYNKHVITTYYVLYVNFHFNSRVSVYHYVLF